MWTPEQQAEAMTILCDVLRYMTGTWIVDGPPNPSQPLGYSTAKDDLLYDILRRIGALGVSDAHLD